MFELKQLLMNQATENNNAGGSGGQSGAEESKDQAPTKTKGDTDHALLTKMYDKDQTSAPEEQQKQETTQVEKADGDDSGYVEPVGKDSGYGDDAPATDDKKPDDKSKDDKADDKKADDTGEYKFDETGIDKEVVPTIKDFATKHKLAPEAVKEMAAFLKEQGNAVEKYKATEGERIQQARAAQKTQFFNELKNDKDFGGANFNKNIKKAETMINNHLPGFKNILTKNKGMVPPSIMKDLAKMYETVHGTDPMVNSQGASHGTGNTEHKFLNDMYS